jgi:hypothetical protein
MPPKKSNAWPGIMSVSAMTKIKGAMSKHASDWLDAHGSSEKIRVSAAAKRDLDYFIDMFIYGCVRSAFEHNGHKSNISGEEMIRSMYDDFPIETAQSEFKAFVGQHYESETKLPAATTRGKKAARTRKINEAKKRAIAAGVPVAASVTVAKRVYVRKAAKAKTALGKKKTPVKRRKAVKRKVAPKKGYTIRSGRRRILHARKRR